MRQSLTAAVVAVVAMTGPSEAQWLNYPDPRLPRTADGKVMLTAPAPRAPDGKPDLSGVWHVQSESLEEKRRIFGPDFGTLSPIGMEADTISKYAVNLLLDYKAGEIIMTPEAEAIFKRRQESEFLPTTYCLPAGVPLNGLATEVIKIVQAPGLILMMYELDWGMSRQIYTDGRPLPKTIAFPAWLGYSVGRWNGDTLVVDTVGFNDKSWLDFSGHPRSEAARITEKYRRRDVGHLDVETTIDDPRSYNKPFSFKVTHLLQPDTDIIESVCAEGERDRAHMSK